MTTTDQRALVERLNATERCVQLGPVNNGEMRERLINPDGPEAADYITALQAERDEWRARWNHQKNQRSAVQIARNRALQGVEHWKARALAAEQRGGG